MTIAYKRDLERLIEKLELEVISRAISGSGHYKLELQAKDGTTKKFVIAKSPSDHRTRKNTEAMLKSFATAHAA
jgi:hypothetical protein